MLATTQTLAPDWRKQDDQLLFLMAKPDMQAAIAIDQVRAEHGLPRKYAIGRFHITLQPFGDIRTISLPDLDRIRFAAASLQAEPFEVTLDRLRNNALVGSKMRALRDFQRALVARLAAFDVIVPDYGFDPHVSLAYSEWKPRNISVAPVRWPMQELLLINSIHGKGHELVDSWPLISRQGSLPF